MIATFLWLVGWSKVKGGDCKLLDGGSEILYLVAF